MGRKVERKNWYRDPLTMPIGEIVQEYRTAKNPNKMIDILADMNDTNPVRIAWILNRCGMTVDPKKMPRAPRSECEEEPREYWAKSDDAVECDRIRQRFEALEAEREQKAREAAQSRPGFDEPDMTVPEVLKPFVVEAMEQVKTGCTVEKETEREVRAVAAERMFETDSQFIKRVTEEYGVPDDVITGGSEEDPPETEDLIAGLWEVFLQYRAKIGKGALSVADVLFMQALARDAREMEWED